MSTMVTLVAARKSSSGSLYSWIVRYRRTSVSREGASWDGGAVSTRKSLRRELVNWSEAEGAGFPPFDTGFLLIQHCGLRDAGQRQVGRSCSPI